MSGRNYVTESKDVATHQYAYDFDYLMHGYMWRTFMPFLRDGSALEMGSYQGDFTARLAGHFDDLTVIEAASNLIEKTRARVPIAKEGRPVAFHHGTFETFGVLRLVNDWLTHTGCLFLVVPNARAASRQIAVKMGLIPHNAAVTPAEKEHGHRCTYSFDTLERDARAGGLRVQHRAGIFFKPFANFQFDRLMKTDIINADYLEACYQLGMQYPDLCASIFLLGGKGA